MYEIDNYTALTPLYGSSFASFLKLSFMQNNKFDLHQDEPADKKI